MQVGFLSGSTYQVLYQAQGDSVGDSFGASVSTAGDINHDGFTDFLVGSPCNDRDGKDAGSARVFSGHLYPASWNNYGAGFPGTNCEPSLTAGGAPVICETITLDITNCSGQNTPSLLIAGLAPGVISNPSGGTILVSPPWVLHPFMLPIAGASLPVEVLCDSAFCGLTIYAQALEFDPGAGGPNQDVSSSKGLALVLGGS
ncbi:MAG: integrin alpha [Planctomycetota bacterium]